MSKGSECPFQSAASYLSGKTDEANVIKLRNTNAFDNSNSTHFPEEVVGGGSVIVPHCHLQRLFLQLKGKKGEEDRRRETVMADPVGVFAHGIHLYAASVLICIQGVGSIKQLWHATFVWKTARLSGGRPCCPGCIYWEYCASLYVSWYTLEEMETFANSAAAVLLFLAYSGQ